MTYRLYIDEVGNGDLKAAAKDPNARYLSLTGYLAKASTHDEAMQVQFDDFKQEIFGSTPGKHVILHRRELVRREGIFKCLHDPDLARRFDDGLLHIIDSFPALVLTVQIDKRAHLEKYNIWHADPYHYCLQCMIERYVAWLEHHGHTGDVFIEARNKEPDRRLIISYARLYNNGTKYMRGERFRKSLISKKIQLRTKSANIAGLQIADLIAHPSARYMRFVKENIETPEDFGTKINQILLDKRYLRNRDSGRLEGLGLKWLP